MVAQWLALSPHSKKVPGSNLTGRAEPFCVEFACSLRACVGFLRVLRFSLSSQKTCTGYVMFVMSDGNVCDICWDPLENEMVHLKGFILIK
ncbi:hypothetical protein LDENG_00016050 [Lucifuga dentata]|nr:hypothetical protein LDENG_00016050 [Lucifuga dentata]